ncbi:lactate dehydrogenase related dehydrogenase [Liquorilactobacillus aquaticus DSM 21051]|uniref:Lactate dehydrogenase related dehydrogenase n=1 Tax=Liquorilactobacillus aquaticus DSM 21051 TaxID=1423725 RepID=A0A0R2CU03_9LACO|nr:NAD(P)-dependent oxidoreductase [Liquorilactobacillus aquaticus]KRM95127.1 lactate dehydrogenase related dehydrogenase [Liquorilactobacillus aquaticus DSM 21051]
MKIIYIVEPIEESGINLLRKAGYSVYVRPQTLSIEESRSQIDFQQVVGMIIRASDLTASELSLFKNLAIISRHGVGVDNLPLDTIKKRNICLTYTPGLNADSVAELTLLLVLNLLRKIPVNKVSSTFPVGSSLENKKVGLIGYGNIAQKFSSYLTPFNNKLLVYNHRPKKLSYGKQVSLTYLLAESDIVSLHIPSNKDTRGLIGEKELKGMKKTAFLINTARGSIVDSDALYEALINKKIAGAAVDVLDVGQRHVLNDFIKLDNFIATPHIGANTNETLKLSSLRCAKEILLFFNGQKPIKPYL